MANIFDYLDWRGDLTFEEAPFCEVDAVMFCQIEYNKLMGVVPPEFLKKAPTLAEIKQRFINHKDYKERKNVGAMINPLTTEILERAADCRRYASVTVCGYRETLDYDKEEQFSAITFSWTCHKKRYNCITYRGTDDTILGWKEDFNLCFKENVPSQVDALSYLKEMSKALSGNIIISGHSKGGNIAVYSAAKCDLKINKRITDVYNFDGPGFNSEFLETDGYRSILRRLHSYLPKTSLVGMLFHHTDAYITVDSDQKGGIMQHDPFTWQVKGPHFEELPDVDDESRYISQTLNGWMYGVPLDQREYFIQTVFEILNAPEAKTSTEFSANMFSNVIKVIKAATKLDSKTKDAVFKTVQLLFKLARINYGEMKASRK